MQFDVQQLGWLEQFDKWLETVAVQYGYPGIFLISFIGTASIVIPIPYTIFIFTIGSLRILDPFLVAVSGAAGSALGEFFGYFLGYYGRTIVSEERQKKMADRRAHAALGRSAKPEEVAAVALFMVSDEASYVDGVAWLVDGGALA